MKPINLLTASLLASVLYAAPPALADSLHIAYLMPFEGPYGTIGHIYWLNGRWTFEEATMQAKAPTARSDSHLSGYFQVDNSHDPPITSQHIFYIDASNHVHELSQVFAFVFTEPWTHNDIFQEAANNPSSSSPIVSPAVSTALTAYYMPAYHTQHVFYIGDDSHVHELKWDAQQGWRHNDLTQLTPAARNSGPGGALIGSNFGTTGVGGTNNFVSYIGVDSHVHGLLGSPIGNQWYDADITHEARGGPPPPNSAAGTSLGCGASAGEICITYLGIDSHVHLINVLPNGGGYHDTDLTQSAANNPSNPGAFSNPVVDSALAYSPGLNWGGVGEVVAYIGEDGDVHHLRWDSTFSAWTHTDLTTRIPAVGASGTALGVAVVQLDGDYALSEHVVHIGNDGQVYDLMLQEKFGGSWLDYNLMRSAGATVPIPRSALATYVGPAW
jgi:hypothetical protein